jgi:ribonuclease T1
MAVTRRQHPLFWVGALLLLALGTFWQQRNQSEPTPQTPTEKPAPSSTTAPARAPAATDRIDELVHDADERIELRKTLDLIARGGPFPYRNDGAVFGNRERRLPQQQRGYYREYTVTTPNARNRGARRVVRGNGGETYYTNDHYATFVRID